MATKRTARAELIVKVPGLYTKYIFKNLDVEEANWDRYIPTTRCPNWQGAEPAIGDVGFVTFVEAKAGDEYYDANTDTINHYKTDDVYFMAFTKMNESPNNVYEF